MPTANISGVNLNYEIAGKGEAVVFLHGYTGSARDWANQMKVLSPKYRVVALDTRGHGKSAAPSKEEEYSISIFAEDVFALLNKLNIKKCCLVGHSFGGFTALKFALEHQDRLAALVLVDTSGGQLVRAPGYAQLRQKLDELARTDGVGVAFEYDATHNPARIDRFQRHPELREVMRQKALMTPVDGYIYVSKALDKREPVTSRLSEIRVPTLIYRGEEDTPFVEAVQVLKQGIPDSKLVTVKGVGHNPHEEAPDVFNEALLKFLDRISW